VYFADSAATTSGDLSRRSQVFGGSSHDYHVLAAFKVHDNARVSGEVACLDGAPLAVQVKDQLDHHSPPGLRAGTRGRRGAQPVVVACRRQARGDFRPGKSVIWHQHMIALPPR
jgi:hypothetical protein